KRSAAASAAAGAAATRIVRKSGNRAKRGLDRRHDLIDLRFLDDERRRTRERVAGRTNHHAGLEALEESLKRARSRRTLSRLELDAGDDADGPHVDDMRRTTQ